MTRTEVQTEAADLLAAMHASKIDRAFELDELLLAAAPHLGTSANARLRMVRSGAGPKATVEYLIALLAKPADAPVEAAS